MDSSDNQKVTHQPEDFWDTKPGQFLLHLGLPKITSLTMQEIYKDYYMPRVVILDTPVIEPDGTYRNADIVIDIKINDAWRLPSEFFSEVEQLAKLDGGAKESFPIIGSSLPSGSIKIGERKVSLDDILSAYGKTIAGEEPKSDWKPKGLFNFLRQLRF